jgi:phage-related protein
MPPMKTISFEGHTLETIKAFPDNARQRVGYELYRVQCGLDPKTGNPLVRLVKVYEKFVFRWVHNTA